MHDLGVLNTIRLIIRGGITLMFTRLLAMFINEQHENMELN